MNSRPEILKRSVQFVSELYPSLLVFFGMQAIGTRQRALIQTAARCKYASMASQLTLIKELIDKTA